MDRPISTTGKVPVFARNSSGLVRAASATDASFVNMYVATFPIMLGFMLGLVLAFYPGVNIFLTLTIGFILAIPLVLAYAMASTIMKRSGGDYIFISRTIHPAIGFAANFVFVVFNTVFLTSTGYYFCIWGLSPLARFLGVQLGNADLVSLSNSLVQPFAIFVVGELFVIGFAALFILGSIRAVLKVFRYTMVVSLVGLAATVIVLLLSSPAGVQTAFDAYVKVATGVTGASKAVLDSAATNGYTDAPFDFGMTLLAVSWPAFSLPFYLGSAYFAGEVRSARLSQLLAGPVTAIIAFVAAIILAFLALNAIGQGFLASLVAASPSATGLGGAPTYMEVAAIASGNPVVGSLIIIGFASWLFPTVPMSLLIMTRCIFAWSMDRVVPDNLSKVTERSNSPVNAVILVTIVSVVVAWAWAYTSIFTVVVGAFGQIIALGIGSLGAALIPYKFKSLYDLSPVGWYWGKIPVLGVVGVLGAIGAFLMVANFARDPSSGVSISGSPGMFWFSLALFPAGVIIYFVSRAIRRTQGFDIDLAYAEIRRTDEGRAMIQEGTRTSTKPVSALPRLEELLEAAVAAGRAQARYSGYPVGSAVLDAWGVIHTGCNVESAAFAATICAERGAVAAAVAGGAGGLIACVTVARDSDPASCCGVCRQLLAEFGHDLLIVNGSLTSDRLRWGTVADWLPHGFSRASLEAVPAPAGTQG